MIYKIQNECLTVGIDSFGAELKSVKDTNDREYMWSGDKNYWGKTSPVLFPIVGCIKGGCYVHEGENYQISRHGFARDMEFTVENHYEDRIVFYLTDTAETYKMYPFRFRFEIEYRLKRNRLEVMWRVINRENKDMYFALGGHPAFACPNGVGKRTDCYIHFDTKEKLELSEVNLELGLVTGNKKEVFLDDGYLLVEQETFDQDALVIENNQCHEISLCSKEKKPFVTVSFDAPLVGVWSVKDSDANFVCIEPWYGRCDRTDFEGELKDKEWINKVKPQEIFEASYCIEV